MEVDRKYTDYCLLEKESGKGKQEKSNNDQ